MMLLELHHQWVSQSCHRDSTELSWAEGWFERGKICVVPIPLFNKWAWNTFNFQFLDLFWMPNNKWTLNEGKSWSCGALSERNLEVPTLLCPGTCPSASPGCPGGTHTGVRRFWCLQEFLWSSSRSVPINNHFCQQLIVCQGNSTVSGNISGEIPATHKIIGIKVCDSGN